MYEWEVPESEYKEKLPIFEQKYLVNQNIEGIYQSKTPLKFKALHQMSCMLRPKKSLINLTDMALSRDYSIAELENIGSKADNPYLKKGSFQVIQLFHIQLSKKAESPQVLAAMFGDTQEIELLVVDPNRKKEEHDLPLVSV